MAELDFRTRIEQAELRARESVSRQLFIAGDQQVVLEISRTFLNVRICVNGGRPVAVHAELLDAVATALHQAHIELSEVAAQRAGSPHGH